MVEPVPQFSYTHSFVWTFANLDKYVCLAISSLKSGGDRFLAHALPTRTWFVYSTDSDVYVYLKDQHDNVVVLI